MNVTPQRPIFNRRSESNVYRMFFWVLLVLGGVWLIKQIQQGNIKPLFLPTATPTRNVASYALEGDAQFTAGNIDNAISAYHQATQVDPSNGEVWAKLARIQTYSSAYLTKDADRLARLKEALASADQAVALSPDDSTAHGIRAFVLDWNAAPSLVGDQQAQEYLSEAEQEAVRSLQLDINNAQALAFYSEILVDQQKWTQAELNIQNADNLDPSLMDIHRVYAYVLESLGEYNQAIHVDHANAPSLLEQYLQNQPIPIKVGGAPRETAR
ncbi:MAG: tetratricopeptide repeat protein, partial [Anaerolineales bacterium]